MTLAFFVAAGSVSLHGLAQVLQRVKQIDVSDGSFAVTEHVDHLSTVMSSVHR